MLCVRGSRSPPAGLGQGRQGQVSPDGREQPRHPAGGATLSGAFPRRTRMAPLSPRGAAAFSVDRVGRSQARVAGPRGLGQNAGDGPQGGRRTLWSFDNSFSYCASRENEVQSVSTDVRVRIMPGGGLWVGRRFAPRVGPTGQPCPTGGAETPHPRDSQERRSREAGTSGTEGSALPAPCAPGEVAGGGVTADPEDVSPHLYPLRTFNYILRELPKVPAHVPVCVLGNYRDMGEHRVVLPDDVRDFIDNLDRWVGGRETWHLGCPPALPPAPRTRGPAASQGAQTPPPCSSRGPAAGSEGQRVTGRGSAEGRVASWHQAGRVGAGCRGDAVRPPSGAWRAGWPGCGPRSRGAERPPLQASRTFCSSCTQAPGLLLLPLRRVLHEKQLWPEIPSQILQHPVPAAPGEPIPGGRAAALLPTGAVPVRGQGHPPEQSQSRLPGMRLP